MKGSSTEVKLRHPPKSRIAVSALLLMACAAGSLGDDRAPARPQVKPVSQRGPDGGDEFTRLFMYEQDIENTRGKIEFKANTPRFLRNARGLPAGAQVMLHHWRGDQLYLYGASPVNPSKTRWAPFRARTRDCADFTYEINKDGEDMASCVIHEKSTLAMFDIAYNKREDVFLAVCRAVEEQAPHEVYGYHSKDGLHWEPCGEGVLYRDHDAFSAMWHPERNQYIVYQTTYQEWSKPYPDNIPRWRRVLSYRTSTDGIHWEPPIDGPPTNPWPRERLITPDAEDTPELEFYWFNAFRYADRYIGLMRDYCPSPMETIYPVRKIKTKHGSHLMMEWWVSRDGFEWKRPWRDTHAIRVLHGPIRFRHELLFIAEVTGSDNGESQVSLHGLKRDRIASTGSRANAEFSSHLFRMPATPLYLNVDARLNRPDGAGFPGQAYVMVEARDERDNTIPGYERGGQIIVDVDSVAHPLLWRHEDGTERNLTELTGRNIRLRFYLRDARIYAVSTMN